MITATAGEESDVAAVSHAISEWALVWVSVSDCLKRWLWQLPSELRLASQLLWQSLLPSL